LSFLSAALRSPGERFAIDNSRTGQRLADRMETAFDSAARRRGLLGRREFDRGSALVIAPCSAIHTFFMNFPIDVVFVTKNGIVTKTYASLQAWRIAFSVRAYAVLELPAGALSAAPTTRGDSLCLAPPDLRRRD
jgi:uncharacterized membrane protein (UPF0127 family)